MLPDYARGLLNSRRLIWWIISLLLGCASTNAVAECEGDWLVRIQERALSPDVSGRVIYEFMGGDTLVSVACDEFAKFLDHHKRSQISILQMDGKITSQPINETDRDDEVEKSFRSGFADDEENFLENDGFDQLSDDWRQCDSVAIAIIDSGVDTTHPGLNGVLFSSEYNAISNEEFQTDDYGHGTHVTGLIAANGALASTGARYPQGACFSASLLPVRFLNQWGGGRVSDAVSAIQWAVEAGAGVINHSWVSTRGSEALQQVLEDADQRDIVQVAAAGNQGVDLDRRGGYYPAGYASELPGMVAVANWSDSSASLYSTSNYGIRAVAIAASGTNLNSLAPGSGTRLRTGTSMSTPVVSAAIAMLRHQFPEDTNQQIVARLLSSCQVDSVLGGMVQCGGRLKAELMPASVDVGIDTVIPGDGYVTLMGTGLDRVLGWYYEEWGGNRLSLAASETSASEVVIVGGSLNPGQFTLELADGKTLFFGYEPTLLAPSSVNISQLEGGFLISWNAASDATTTTIEADYGDGDFAIVASIEAPISQYFFETNTLDLVRVRLKNEMTYEVEGDTSARILESDYTIEYLLNADASIWKTLAVATTPAGTSPTITVDFQTAPQASALQVAAGSGVELDVRLDGLRMQVTVADGATAIADTVAVTYVDDTVESQRIFQFASNTGESWQLPIDGDLISLTDPELLIQSASLLVDGSVVIDTREWSVKQSLFISLDSGDQNIRSITIEEHASMFSVDVSDGGALLQSLQAIEAGSLKLHIDLENTAIAAFASQDRRCFIASVLFPDSPGVLQWLRTYRDVWLLALPLGVGDWMVESYYRVSPFLAWYLDQHSNLAVLARILFGAVFLGLFFGVMSVVRKTVNRGWIGY